MCFPWQVGCQIEEGAKSALNDAIDNLAAAVVDAFERVVASLGTVWVYIGTPDLTGTGGGSSIDAGEYPVVAGTNLETVLGYVTWVGFGIAILALMALGAHMSAMMKRGTGELVLGRVAITGGRSGGPRCGGGECACSGGRRRPGGLVAPAG